MQPSSLHFFPLAVPFVLALLLVLGLWIISVEIGILRYAYEKMGVDRRYIFSLLVLSLLGSYVNIPVAELPGEQILPGQEIYFFGMRHIVPMIEGASKTTVAVNLGGAVIPTCLSLFLLVRKRLYGPALAGVTIVAAIVHTMAQPVRGVGIAVPVFVPPILAAAVAVLLSRRAAPSLAYISGSLGTLIGADLLNLNRLQGLGAPVASIGGAGTFDGIFVTGILAVLLA
jgi:uncharacterized membrane protein